jgi:hypothetical protein
VSEYVILRRTRTPVPTVTGVGWFLSVQYLKCTSGEERKQESRDAITISGKRIVAGYRVEWNETYTKVAREALAVGGKSKELTARKVFLVDLAGHEPVYARGVRRLSSTRSAAASYTAPIGKRPDSTSVRLPR